MEMQNRDIRATSLADLKAHAVAPLSDGTRAYVADRKQIFYLDKTNGNPDNGTTVIEPLAGNPIAGAADARWVYCACIG